jgi:OmpA-OmpF porin, OOP family
MCNWKSWIWPGLITTAVLTALTGWFLSGPVESDLTLRAGEALKGAQPWSNIQFDGRDATVSGVAESEAQLSDAAKLALGTYGVRVVANTAALPPKADPFVLSMIKDSSGVSLKGNYATSESRAAIVAAAEKAMPGIAVKDELTLAAGKPEGFEALAAFGVAQLADLTSGEVSLNNLEYSIKGDVVDVSAYNKITADAARLPAGGVLKMADLIKPAEPVAIVEPVPAPVAPYAWSASSSTTGVMIEGSVPSAEVGAAAIDLAKRRFIKTEVTDAQTVVAGAPEGFADAQASALKTLSYLSEGRATISDNAVTLEGNVPSQAIKALVEGKASSGLPAAYTLTSNIVVVEPVMAAAAPVEAPKPYVWTATSNADGVKLEGSVLSGEVGKSILDVANATFVGKTINNAQTPLNLSPAGFAAAQGVALKGLAQLQEGVASITDNAVSLSGVAASEDVKAAVVKSMTDTLPSGYVLTTDALAVAVPVAPAAPYAWSATSSAAGVMIEGSVPSADVGAAALDLAKRRFVKTEVTDAQTVLEGAPEGFADAQSGLLRAMSYLIDGKSTITNTKVTLAGAAPSEAVKKLATDKAASNMPAGFEFMANINVVEPVMAAAVVEAPKPYVWTATSNADGVKLEGSVLSSDVGNSILEVAAANFPGKTIANAQAARNSSPAGFAAVQREVLKGLSKLQEGTASLTDNAVSITGVAASDDVKVEVVKSITDSLPQGYGLTDTITVASPPAVEPAPVAEPTPAPVDCIMIVKALLTSGQINFEANKSVILDSSKEVLSKIATTLGSCPDVSIEVAGHTDSDGSDEYNQRLSQDRAFAVRQVLVASGVKSGRITSVGLGETMPVAGNDTKENKAKNRRIEFRAVQ